jgi:hypothetical protein
VKSVNGGSAEQVREALYKTMDRFSQQSKEGYQKKLAELKEQNLSDFKAKQAAMLKALNDKLIKNEINKEKTRRHASWPSWRDSSPKQEAEDHVRANWVDYAGE